MKVIVALLVIMAFGSQPLFAQEQGRKRNARPELRKGNELYQQKKYKEAQQAYVNALQKDPTSYTGMFNMGDALYNSKQYEPARQALEASAKAATGKNDRAKAYHNIGNTYLQERKWEEAINAYKQALRLNPSDADTKYNLAYANAMLKKEGGGKDKKDNKDNKDKKDNKDNKDNKDQKDNKDNKDQKKDDKDNKGDKDKKDDQKDKQDQGDKGDKGDKEQQRPQGQPSKLSQQQAENLLNALRQEEKKLQDKKDKEKGVPVKLDKDW